MATPRLPFLWPMLFKPTTSPSPTVRATRAAARNRLLHSSRSEPQHNLPQRYGPANEPLPHLRPEKAPAGAPKDAKALPRIGDTLQHKGEEVRTTDVKMENDGTRGMRGGDENATKRDPTTIDIPPSNAERARKKDAAEASPSQAIPSLGSDKPMETLLESVPEPAAVQKDGAETAQQNLDSQQKSQKPTPPPNDPTPNDDPHAPPPPPHISPPTYVHHFDTYSLVKSLTANEAWTPDQAITIMKTVRLVLAENMDLATAALISKSTLENEAYLFKAACSELRTEVHSKRHSLAEQQRTERTQLQHEVEILTQRLNQEAGQLKDSLKGMFDDRTMAVRNEQRGVEARVQELGYRITVSLQADSRSEVEGLRWVMTRRVIIALGVIIGMVVGSLKLYSSALHEEAENAKRRARMRSEGSQTEGGGDAGQGSGGGGGEEKMVGVGEIVLAEGDNPGLVTLG